MVTDSDPTQDKDALTALAGQLTPQALDQHLRSASADGVYYPAQMMDVLRAIKQEAGLADGQLREAARCSAYLRRAALARPDRQHDKEGSFAYVVIADEAHPEESLVVKIHRHPSTGAGLGSLGGILEATDGGDVQPKRELIEELVDEYDTVSAETKQQLEEVLNAMQMQPLFSCRDDAHVIERGWGWRVDAHAHMAVIPQAMLSQSRDVFKALAEKKPKGIEVDSLELIALKDLPIRVPGYCYGHEAFGDMVSAQVTFDQAGIAFDVLAHYRKQNPEALQWMADKMYLRESDLITLYERVCEDAKRQRLAPAGDRPYRRFSDHDYCYACDPPAGVVGAVLPQGQVTQAPPHSALIGRP